MIQSFLNIRIKQGYRALAELGAIRSLIIIALLCMLIALPFLSSQLKTLHFYLFVGFNSLTIGLIHLKRKDRTFLKVNFDSYKLIYQSEYLILSLPILLLLLYKQAWLPSLLLLIIIYGISFIELEFKQRSLNTKIQQWIPDESFEWKAGVREYFPTMGIIGFLGLIFTPFWVGAAPIAIALLGMFIPQFYQNYEPYQMVVVFERSNKAFLKLKISQCLKLASLLFTPYMLLFVLFHHEIWYIPFIQYFIFISLYVYTILMKYTFYEPNKTPTINGFFIALGMGSFLFPIFLPLVWILTIRFYFKSLINLNLYLDDYN